MFKFKVNIILAICFLEKAKEGGFVVVEVSGIASSGSFVNEWKCSSVYVVDSKYLIVHPILSSVKFF